MTSKAQMRRMFAGGNTSRGFRSFYDHLIGQDATRTIVLKGGPGVGKSTLMKYIAEHMSYLDYDVELFHCSSDPSSLDGVVMPKVAVALMDGTAPHVMDPRFPGAVDEILYLGDYWNEPAMRAKKNEIIACSKDATRHFQRAYRFLRTAGDILDDWSDANAEALDIGAANKLCHKVILEVFGDARVSDHPGKARHLFASAITPDGFINYLDTVVIGCSRRYVIRGGPGSGKSTLIERVADHAVRSGLDVELFHCSLNPDSLEHLVMPAIKTALITSVEPHVWAGRPNDIIVDMEQCLDTAIVERNAKIADYDRSLMQEAMDRAILFLGQARDAHRFLESFYIPNIDFDAVQGLRERTLQRILEFASETPVIARGDQS
ncbi:MAG: PRK06851 family protein [Firmicutes bacterium]|nr:PRK06851 family protein [Bacillota bacterium]MDD4337601.1 PRK06851 family protein [Bacillota bacterium]MDD4793340.1 PRK06851 family protein [Bacillota bacterium]